MSDSGARRRQWVGFVLSGIFPGLGQLYNREYLKGLLFAATGAALCWLATWNIPADPLALLQPSGALMLLLTALLVLWIWAIVDAWRVGGR